MTAEEEMQLRNMLGKMCEFMNCEVQTEVVTTLRVTVPGNRTDVATILNKVAAHSKKR